MKTVAYLFLKIDWRHKQPKFKPLYKNPTEYLFTLGKKNGLLFILTDLKSFNLKEKSFKAGWSLNNEKWKKIGKFKPNLIYDKSSTRFKNIGIKTQINNKIPIVNHPLFDLICEHKFFSYLYLKKYSPKTFILNKTTKNGLNKILKEIKTNLVVTKPIFGSGGKNVKIIPHQQLAKIKEKGEQIIQEFIDSSSGIKNLTKETHDLRIVMINGRISYSYLRIPKKNSLIANVAQGGKMINLKISQIPTSAKKIIKNIDTVFYDFWPRIYTADLIFNKKQKPYLIEINSKPGIYFYPQDKKLQTKFYSDIINALKSSL